MQKDFGNDNKALNNVSVCMHEIVDARIISNRNRGNNNNNIIVSSTSAIDTNTINSFNASKTSKKLLRGNSNTIDSLSALPAKNSNFHDVDQSSSSKHMTKGSPMIILLLQ